MSDTTRTPYGIAAQLASLFGVETSIQDFSTLNEKFAVDQSEVLVSGEKAIIQYIGIGNRGHEVTVTDGIAAVSGVNRLGTAAALFSHIPFFMRPIADDTNDAKVENLRLRAVESYSGVDYAVYYLRKILPSALSLNVGYVPTVADLNPTPTTQTASSLVRTTMEVEFELTAEEVQDIREAQVIIHGVSGFATISEVGLITGVERSLPTDYNGTTEHTAHVVGAQLHSSVNAGKLLDFSAVTATATTLTVGGLDPIFGA